jgi:fluoroquinolone resistance protein
VKSDRGYFDKTMAEIQSDAEYVDRAFDAIDLKKVVISQSEFQSCDFNRCNLSQSVFIGCRFDDCTFQACDLSLVKFKEVHLRNSTFVGSKLVGIDWTGIAKTFSADFSDCVLNLSNFSAMNLKKRKIVNCIAHEVSFAECNMTECDCKLTDFAGSVFSKTNLTKANFTDARNYTIDVRANTTTKMKLSLPEALSLLETLGIIITK